MNTYNFWQSLSVELWRIQAGMTTIVVSPPVPPTDNIQYLDYIDERNLPDIQQLVSKDLSEPYSIFTYRYFLHNWPKLCICAYATTNDENGNTKSEMIGTIVCKADQEYGVMKGYIAMLTVNTLYRKQGIGLYLAKLGIQRMIDYGCEEILLETEVRFMIVSLDDMVL